MKTSLSITEMDVGQAEDRRLSPGHYLLIGARTKQDAGVVRRVMRVVAERLEGRRAVVAEARIDALVDVFLEQEPRSSLETLIEEDNALLRARFLEAEPTLTAPDLHRLAASSASNRSALAAGWKREGRVFAVPCRGIDRFPAFQFADGHPRKVIRAILQALPPGMTPWQTAFWFVSGNGWLDDAAPKACLDTPDRVLLAAQQLGEPAIG